MLKKILSIKNVGTFRNHNASGDIGHRKITLIHAENGRGKTTLCAILRSLRFGDSNLINERKTLDSENAPQVSLLFDSGKVEFKESAWTANLPQIEIYDGNFITENVYSGDVIGPDHKRNLCRVVLGAEGVKLAEKLDKLVAEAEAAAAALTTLKADVERLVPRGMTLEDFLALKPDPQIDQKVAEKEEELSAQDASKAIAERASLVPLTLASFNFRGLVETLGKTVAGISADAAERVRDHIQSHLKGDSVERRFSPENWLADGVQQSMGKWVKRAERSRTR
jgi:wobble nucleotide-excising tRNase